MIMISILAEEIYERSIQLKKYNSKNLFFKKNRMALIKDLYAIQELNNDILHKLYGETDYSIEYQELALFMSKTLAECALFLTSKSSNYRNTVIRYIWGFHNLPRAFLPTENTMKITPKEAMVYYKPYLKLD